MEFTFQHVRQAELEMGKMPNPDVLACCHASGKRTRAMTQEILFFPLRWLCRPCQHINQAGEREGGDSGGYRGSDFPYGWVVLQTWTESLGSRKQAEALTAVCQFWHNVGMSHLSARALNWPKYNLDTLTLLGSPLLMSKPFQLSVITEIVSDWMLLRGIK